MEIITLYNGDVKIEYDDLSHTYFYNGKPVDGVTSVNRVIDKPKLNDWKIREDLKFAKNAILEEGKVSRDLLDSIFIEAETAHNKKKEDAGVFGTAIHDWIEAYVKGKKPPLPKGIKEANRIKKFLAWAKESKAEFLESERIIFSREDLYCGTLDLVLRMNGKLYIGDIKTSKKPWGTPTGMKLEWFLQTAAYQKAYYEETGILADGRVIIRIGEDGLETMESDRYEEDISSFLAALTLTRRVRSWNGENSY